MVQKLALTAIAIFLLSTSSAAPSAVENDADNELTSGGLAIHTSATGTEILVWRCIHHWRGTIDSNGHIGLDDINISSGPGTVVCASANDCNSAGWEGQIEEDHPNWEYVAHITLCISGGPAALDGIPVSIECQVADTEMHCGGTHDGTTDENENEAFVGNFTIAPGVVLPFFFEGEVAISDVLGLMHEEA